MVTATLVPLGAGQLDHVRAGQPVAQERQHLPGVGAEHQRPGVGPGGHQLLALVLGAGVVLVGRGATLWNTTRSAGPSVRASWPTQNPADRC